MWFSAWEHGARLAGQAMAQSSRVRFTISMMVRTPAFRSDPLGIGGVEFDFRGGASTCCELVFRRWKRIAFWLPSGGGTGIR
jgi:hypothetical protein